MIPNHVSSVAAVDNTDDDSDLYSGFNDVHPALDTRNLHGDEDFQQAVLKSSYGRRGFTGKRQTGPSRMGTAGFRKTAATPTTGQRRSSTQGPATARPVTAVRGAGYTSSTRASSGTTVFDPLNQAKAFANRFQQKDDTTPEAKIRGLEKRVNDLLEESILAASRGDQKLSLEKGKEAVAKEKSLTKQKERMPVTTEGITMNLDLAFAVQFNLAVQQEKMHLFNEAIATYTSITKNRSFATSGRLKLNVGNIHFAQGNYGKAIKLYRMALDQVPNTHKSLRMEIMKNIALAFVRLNQFTDAVTSFEYIMSEKPDHRTALHLIVCHYALDDRPGMRKTFSDLLEVHSNRRKTHLASQSASGSDEEEDEDGGRQLLSEVIRSDRLRMQLNERQQEQNWCILTSAKLISPVIGDNISAGFEWTVEAIRSAGHSDLADDLEISKAVKHLRKREFAHAIETLKRFEKKDGRSAATAATNLSFLFLLQNEVTQAEKYADLAIESDRYNTGALVNKGNCLFRKEDLVHALDYYREALNNQSTCPEALYNSMLAHKRLGHADQALDAALRLNHIVHNHPYFLFQMANIYELLNERDLSLDWYQKVLAFVPTDATLLNRLSDISDAERDRHQALAYLNESFRYFPSHIPTMERLASHFIENQAYEKAIRYLEKAAAVQPHEIKWHLMVAACFRRSGNYQSALKSYVATHKKFPESVECLKFLIRLSDDMGLPEGREYTDRLRRLEKARELNSSNSNHRKELRSSSRTSKRSAASSSREGSASSNSSGYVTESSRINSRKSGLESELMTKGGDSFTDELDVVNERPTTSWRRKAVDEDDFEGDEVDAILPE